jgi:hypothetical protein
MLENVMRLATHRRKPAATGADNQSVGEVIDPGTGEITPK